MDENTQEKTYEVTLPLKDYTELVEGKTKAEAERDSYASRFWDNRDKAARLDEQIKDLKAVLTKSELELESYNKFFDANPTAKNDYQIWLTTYKGDEEI